ncbi:3-hydroxyacyl-CoA dehydrogenase family protein [Amycolatopsis umgeniensis]|uniref:Methoxymalonate biosynthesis protein n=1 Tax=Amycolatopsis umgeniensis TaxID=336628 RepID=A0A841ARL1_9PSEU|nr:3-hydroxyacyl-CoA dehydrogenase family protein [Amycolatopsis umgeniensis]MBB5850536.1 methoxymalonate biosynthesis protein [Amycolatopsis umgeniensis]
MTEPTDAGPVAILGAGVMGRGIATLAAGRGRPVLLVDTDPDQLAGALATVPGQLRLAQLMGALPRDITAGAIETATSVEGLDRATVVVEAVTERIEPKVRALAAASEAVRPGTLLITNTSAIPIDELAGSVDRPEDLVGAHFMNPPYLIRTVEVVRGRRTGEAALAAVGTFLTALGLEYVVVADGPGFVINRILQRMINEAARVVDEGKATPEAVDALFTGCLGHTTGPLATADLIGLDNVVDSLTVLASRTDDAGYRPSSLLLDKVRAGHLGRKTGSGFFEYRSTS